MTGKDRYEGLQVYVGDIHNHCGISYGHGSIEDAYRNARMQLDFASVTGHAWWHDMPSDGAHMPEIRRYHQEGFARLANGWEHVQQVTGDAHEDGRFVSLLSFEWHSMTYGDHCVYYRGDRGPLLRSDSLEELRGELRRLDHSGLPSLAIPHHIGYRKGWRGINWDTYTPEFAPVVEVVSMHGCGVSDQSPRPYLHTMGPRETSSTAYHALAQGHRFGFIGSSDHHSAHPGSYGHGRVAVWAPELTRSEIWKGLTGRHTYALTGDRIRVAAGVNDALMGEVAAAAARRRVWASVSGSDEIDYVEIVRDGEVIHRARPDAPQARGDFCGVVPFTVGWSQPGVRLRWDVRLRVRHGRLRHVQPRLRGEDILAPAAAEPDQFSFSDWRRTNPDTVELHTVTKGNATLTTDGTQGLALRIEGDDRTRLVADINGVHTECSLGELRQGSRTGYLDGFVSGAYQFGRAISDELTELDVDIDDEQAGSRPDWYHVRVRQKNDQWAWASPTWVERKAE